MKKLTAFTLFGGLLISGFNPIFANDWIIPSNSDTYKDPSGDELWDRSTGTTKVEIDCNSNTWYNNTDFLGPKVALCFQRLIDKHNNLGEGVQAAAAMNTAMSALPESSPESKYTCGLGTGGNSGTFALSAGCSSNLSERLTLNTGGSLALADSQDFGSGNIDNYGLKVGFLYKFGQMKEKNLISSKKFQKLEKNIAILIKKNEEIQSENNFLKQQIIAQNQRLENIEKIALNATNSQDLATIKLP